MANELPEQSNWEDEIEAILTTDRVLGEAPGFSGSLNGKINIVLKKIADRTKWLRDNMMQTIGNATSTVRGIIELATQNEARTGTDTTRAMTPARTRDWTQHPNSEATETTHGTVERLTNAEARLATDTTRYPSIATILDAIRNGTIFRTSQSRYGVSQAASQAEVDAGTDTEKHVTSATLKESLKSLLKVRTGVYRPYSHINSSGLNRGSYLNITTLSAGETFLIGAIGMQSSSATPELLAGYLEVNGSRIRLKAETSIDRPHTDARWPYWYISI